MSSEHAPRFDISIPLSTNSFEEKDPEIAMLFEIPDDLQHTFTPLDSHLQGILFRADALVSDNKAVGEKKLSPQKRREDEAVFLNLTNKFGVSPNPYDYEYLGWYDEHGFAIKEQREKILKTGDTDIAKLLDIVSFDKDGRAGTIAQAAD